MSDFRSDPTEPEPTPERTSASEVALSEAEKNGGRPAPIDPVSDEPVDGKAGPEGEGREPESTTVRWKRQVEAEARSRLKKHIRNLGSERRG